MTKDYLKALITIIIAVILALLILMFAREDGPGAKVTQECIPLDMQDNIRKFAKEGFDLGFVERARLLFDNWSKEDPRSHPQRAQVGMQNAIHAYVYAYQLTDAWSAPVCEPKPIGVQ